jgi:hypothetical protein
MAKSWIWLIHFIDRFQKCYQWTSIPEVHQICLPRYVLLHIFRHTWWSLQLLLCTLWEVVLIRSKVHHNRSHVQRDYEYTLHRTWWHTSLLTYMPVSHTTEPQTSDHVLCLHHCTFSLGPLVCHINGDRVYQPKT